MAGEHGEDDAREEPLDKQAMLPPLLAVTIDFYLIAHVIVGDAALSAALAALVGASFLGLWYGLPWTRRAAGRRG